MCCFLSLVLYACVLLCTHHVFLLVLHIKAPLSSSVSSSLVASAYVCLLFSLNPSLFLSSFIGLNLCSYSFLYLYLDVYSCYLSLPVSIYLCLSVFVPAICRTTVRGTGCIRRWRPFHCFSRVWWFISVERDMQPHMRAAATPSPTPFFSSPLSSWRCYSIPH